MPPSDTHKVFISYSWNGEDELEGSRVWKLARDLRAHGVDAWIDRFEVDPGDWSGWLEQQIEGAKAVLVVCTEDYLIRSRNQAGPGVGSGVQWEAFIIRRLTYEQGPNNAKFIPVVFSDDDTQYIPPVLKTRNRYNVSQNAGFRELHGRLFGRPPSSVPPLGSQELLTLDVSGVSPQAEYRHASPETVESVSRAKQDSAQALPAAPINGQDIRLEFIDFDLEELSQTFQNNTDYKGSYPFAVGGYEKFLKTYIVERVLRELNRKTGRSSRCPIDITINPEDLEDEQGIARKLLLNYGTDSIASFFDGDEEVDVLMVVWNYEVPISDLVPVARSFFDASATALAQVIDHQERCFVVVWANVGAVPLDSFERLPLPSQFDVNRLSAWLRAKLRQLGSDQSQVSRWLAIIEAERGNVMPTLNVLDRIAIGS